MISRLASRNPRCTIGGTFAHEGFFWYSSDSVLDMGVGVSSFPCVGGGWALLSEFHFLWVPNSNRICGSAASLSGAFWMANSTRIRDSVPLLSASRNPRHTIEGKIAQGGSYWYSFDRDSDRESAILFLALLAEVGRRCLNSTPLGARQQ